MGCILMGCILGSLSGFLLSIGIPFWLGYHHHSIVWLTPLAVALLLTGGRNNTIINKFWSARRQGKLFRTSLFFVIIPLVWCFIVTTVPYWFGILATHWSWFPHIP